MNVVKKYSELNLKTYNSNREVYEFLKVAIWMHEIQHHTNIIKWHEPTEDGTQIETVNTANDCEQDLALSELKKYVKIIKENYNSFNWIFNNMDMIIRGV